ncbi:hypothetical protein ACFX13_014585 [Malus domestica]
MKDTGKLVLVNNNYMKPDPNAVVRPRLFSSDFSSHSNSSLGPHSRESASTHFSGSRSKSNRNSGSRCKGWRPWKDQFGSIEEEGLLDEDRNLYGLTHGYYLLLLGDSLCFSLSFL